VIGLCVIVDLVDDDVDEGCFDDFGVDSVEFVVVKKFNNCFVLERVSAMFNVVDAVVVVDDVGVVA
jgi:hypothetical protein